METIYIKCFCALLSTSDETNIVENVPTRELFTVNKYRETPYFPNSRKHLSFAEFRHLYILSKDKVKEKNEWCILTDDLGFIIPEPHQYSGNPEDYISHSDLVKIVATTNKTLNLPLIPNKFIKKYCKLNGIDEIRVKYSVESEVTYPNLNEKGEIIISEKTKNSWTKEELPIEDLTILVEYLIKDPFKNRNLNYSALKSVNNLDKWIKENL